MASLAIAVEGEKELRAALRDAGGPELVKALSGAHKSAANVVAGAARPITPRRSGRLAASIRPLGTQRMGRVKAGSANVPYAAAIHWGRKRGNVGSPPGNYRGPNPITGRPFLYDAAERTAPAVYRVFRTEIDAMLDRAIGNR